MKGLFFSLIDSVAQNPKGGFIGFLTSFFISLVPSFIPTSVFVAQFDLQLVYLDFIIKIIQLIAGIVGLLLSLMLLYINWAKVKEIFKKKGDKSKNKNNKNLHEKIQD